MKSKGCLPRHALFGNDSGNAGERASEVGRNGRLHAHLDRLEGTQRNVCDKLGRRTSCQIERGLPPPGVLLANQVAVELFEELVAAVLERALGLCRNVSAIGCSLTLGHHLHCNRKT